jgi:hypothetical protein
MDIELHNRIEHAKSFYSYLKFLNDNPFNNFERIKGTMYEILEYFKYPKLTEETLRKIIADFKELFKNAPTECWEIEGVITSAAALLGIGDQEFLLKDPRFVFNKHEREEEAAKYNNEADYASWCEFYGECMDFLKVARSVYKFSPSTLGYLDEYASGLMVRNAIKTDEHVYGEIPPPEEACESNMFGHRNLNLEYILPPFTVRNTTHLASIHPDMDYDAVLECNLKRIRTHYKSGNIKSKNIKVVLKNYEARFRRDLTVYKTYLTLLKWFQAEIEETWNGHERYIEDDDIVKNSSFELISQWHERWELLSKNLDFPFRGISDDLIISHLPKPRSYGPGEYMNKNIS